MNFQEIQMLINDYESMPLPTQRLKIKAEAKQLIVLLVEGKENQDTRRMAGNMLLEIVRLI